MAAHSEPLVHKALVAWGLVDETDPTLFDVEVDGIGALRVDADGTVHPPLAEVIERIDCERALAALTGDNDTALVLGFLERLLEACVELNPPVGQATLLWQRVMEAYKHLDADGSDEQRLAFELLYDIDFLHPLLVAASVPDEVAVFRARRSDHPRLLCALARRPSAARFLPQNRHTPARVLAALVDHEDAEVRRTVATHPNTPAVVLERLATDPCFEVRQGTAAHPSCPPGALAALADETYLIRMYVAANPNTPPAVVAALAGDGHNMVRSRAARNPSCPPQELARLLLVTDTAALTHRTPEPGWSFTSPGLGDFTWAGHLRGSVASNPSTPEKTLRELVAEPGTGFLFEPVVVGNPGCPDELAVELLVRRAREKSGLEEDRRWVAGHPRTPNWLLQELTADPDVNVVAAAYSQLIERSGGLKIRSVMAPH